MWNFVGRHFKMEEMEWKIWRPKEEEVSFNNWPKSYFSYQVQVNLGLTFDQNNPNPKNGLIFINVLKSHEFWKSNSVTCREFQVEFFNEKREIWTRTEELSSLKVYISLVSVNLQNYKFLESWIELLCTIYHFKKLLVNRRHACESHEKKIVSKGVEMNE